jgi:hypothetical protein
LLSHFSTIGLDATQDTFSDLIIELAERAQEHLPVGRSEYLRWTDPSGAQMILQLDVGGRIIGANPHFVGPTRVPVAMVRGVRRPDDTPMELTYEVWASPSDAHRPESGAHPFVFDCPDPLLAPIDRFPANRVVQIAAFAHEVHAYDSLAAHNAAQKGRKIRFASKSFFPSSILNPGTPSDEVGAPSASALLYGHILDAERMTNALTNRSFWWCHLASLGGDFDVVVDPELLGSASPKPGGILGGTFWLSGRIVDSL